MSRVDLSIVLPCLNEEQTIGLCIEEIREVMEGLDITYEIVVADNGSTDRSVALAEEGGARVVHVKKRGYGNAYLGAIPRTKGRWILMGDADMSYDFHEIPRFWEAAGQGGDIILGSRIRGTIEEGAMPFLHRRLGTPVLTMLLNLLFRTKISDSQSGMRIFSRETWELLNLESPGMEYASEMLVKAGRLGLDIREIPINFRKDRRDRPPHLRSFRDGWRHLRFLILFSPSALFLVPAFLLTFLGIAALAVSLCGLHAFGRNYSFHMSLVGMVLAIVGNQVLFFGLFARLHPLARSLSGDPLEQWFRDRFKLEPWMMLFSFLALCGFTGDITFLIQWVSSGMGAITPWESVRIMTFTAVLMTGIQGVFASFYLSILHIHRYGLK